MAALAAVMGIGILGYGIGARTSGDSRVGGSQPESLWTCSMHPQVLQSKPGACPICGMQLTPVRKDVQAAAPGERKIRYWWDPMMKPPFIADRPGKSPMGMDLIPVYEDDLRAGPAVTIDPVVVQNIGVRVARVEEGPLVLAIRTVGYVREAETRRHDVTLKVDGWIERLHADTEGMFVKEGDPLFDLYSPELLVAQEELLIAKRALDRLPPGAGESLKSETEGLVESARRKLTLWGVPPGSIDETLRAGRPSGTVTFRSPASGFVTEKRVVQGAAVDARMMALRIVDLSEVWIDAQIYESRIPLVKKGLKARATLQGRPEGAHEGEVMFLSPQVDPATRAATARIAVPNPDLLLKPGMFADVEFSVEVSPRALLVPREAVIDTGVRQIAFVALEGGRFEPRLVRMGVETGDGRAQILAGLAPGDRVVTSGQFLLDSESRLREAIQKMTGEKLLQPPAPSQAHERRRSDGVVRPYLEMSRELAADRAVPAKPLDEIIEAARAHGADGEAVGRAAAALRGKELKDQRQAFKKLSGEVIELVRRAPASTSVAGKLFVLHCPMAEAEWIQDSGAVANPYWGSEMLECGAVTRTIETVRP